MQPMYIVVQAGGKGTRMGKLTANKPKALISVNNLPIIFHLFKAFPKSKFIIIGDYKAKTFESYLELFAEVEYEFVNASNNSGTCAGINQALKYIPNNEKFALIWSEENLIGLSDCFECRWRFENNKLEPKPSCENGVAGVFLFKDKSCLSSLPSSGEFVKWLCERKTSFEPFYLSGVDEIGTMESYGVNQLFHCRPFNEIEQEGSLIIKRPLTKQGEDLAKVESGWYRYIIEKNFSFIPKIYGFSPLKMQKIDGKPVYEFANADNCVKQTIIKNIIYALEQLHSLGEKDADAKSFWKVYFEKTFDRIEKVKFIIPFSEDEYIVINGKKCRNVFSLNNEIKALLKLNMPEKFTVIHGDSTFSNILVKNDLSIVLIDPRGYFGSEKIFGDPLYDYAKLFYSLYGNYDQFNNKNFSLTINNDSVEINIKSNQFEELSKMILDASNINMRHMKLLNALIWLSLTTYVWDDYDSICGAFYNGLYYLEEALNEQ